MIRKTIEAIKQWLLVHKTRRLERELYEGKKSINQVRAELGLDPLDLGVERSVKHIPAGQGFV